MLYGESTMSLSTLRIPENEGENTRVKLVYVGIDRAGINPNETRTAEYRIWNIEHRNGEAVQNKNRRISNIEHRNGEAVRNTNRRIQY
jgi:hypothetical protein